MTMLASSTLWRRSFSPGSAEGYNDHSLRGDDHDRNDLNIVCALILLINHHFSRVAWFLPIRQVDVCFLHLPLGFPSVRQYLKLVSVGSAPS